MAVTKTDLESWELQVQDIKNSLGFADEDDYQEYVDSAIQRLNNLEREIWDKKIEPDEQQGKT